MINWLRRRRLQNVVIFSGKNISRRRTSRVASFCVDVFQSCTFLPFNVLHHLSSRTIMRSYCEKRTAIKDFFFFFKSSTTLQWNWEGWLIQRRRITERSNDGKVLSERLSVFSSCILTAIMPQSALVQGKTKWISRKKHSKWFALCLHSSITLLLLSSHNQL